MRYLWEVSGGQFPCGWIKMNVAGKHCGSNTTICAYQNVRMSLNLVLQISNLKFIYLKPAASLTYVLFWTKTGRPLLYVSEHQWNIKYHTLYLAGNWKGKPQMICSPTTSIKWIILILCVPLCAKIAFIMSSWQRREKSLHPQSCSDVASVHQNERIKLASRAIIKIRDWE